MKDLQPGMTRRDAIKVGAVASAGLAFGQIPAFAHAAELISKPIPSSGEMIPVVGIGTARYFDARVTDEEMLVRREVIEQLPKLGGMLIDTAAGYGRGVAESMLGDLVTDLGNRDQLFLATKVRKSSAEEGILEMEASFRKLKIDVIDLMQVHNLVGINEMLPIMREWKTDGRFRYIGASTSSDRQYPDFIAMMEAEDLDFIQVDYSLANRSAAERILPLAADRGMAILVNLPYGRGRLFRAVGDRPLPEWASEFGAKTWGQFFLKYIVSHPAVTCAIPGTYKMAYLEDNLGAATGELPVASLRMRMEEFYDAL